MDQRGLVLFFSSSSDSSDDDERFLLEIVNDDLNCRCHYRIRVPRVQNFIETVIDAYNEQDFQDAFRYDIFFKMICMKSNVILLIMNAGCEEGLLNFC